MPIRIIRPLSYIMPVAAKLGRYIHKDEEIDKVGYFWETTIYSIKDEDF